MIDVAVDGPVCSQADSTLEYGKNSPITEYAQAGTFILRSPLFVFENSSISEIGSIKRIRDNASRVSLSDIPSTGTVQFLNKPLILEILALTPHLVILYSGRSLTDGYPCCS